MTKHNKKRNVGIVYELLVHHITNSILEDDKQSAKKATRIIEKRFAKGTELYKEFRLFNALANSTVTDTHVVASILTEAKRAARNIDGDKLNREKSGLLRDINYIIDKKDFFHQTIPNYRHLGSIQIALNEWRKKNPDLGVLIEFEKCSRCSHARQTSRGRFLLREAPRLSHRVVPEGLPRICQRRS